MQEPPRSVGALMGDPLSTPTSPGRVAEMHLCATKAGLSELLCNWAWWLLVSGLDAVAVVDGECVQDGFRAGHRCDEPSETKRDYKLLRSRGLT